MREDREQPATHSVTHPPTRSPSQRVARVVAIQPPHLNPAPRLRLRCSPAPPLPPHPPLASSSSSSSPSSPSSSSSSGTTTGWTDGPKQNKTYTHRLRPHAWLATTKHTYTHAHHACMDGRVNDSRRLTSCLPWLRLAVAVVAGCCRRPRSGVPSNASTARRWMDGWMDGWMDVVACCAPSGSTWRERETQRNATQHKSKTITMRHNRNTASQHTTSHQLVTLLDHARRDARRQRAATHSFLHSGRGTNEYSSLSQ